MESPREHAQREFVDRVVAAFRREGGLGAIEVRAEPFFRIVLRGPPLRTRHLTPLYGRWLRGDARERERAIAEFARKRFGEHVPTDDPQAVTNFDLKWFIISCCGQEDPALLRCPRCRVMWLECMECDARHATSTDSAAPDMRPGGGEAEFRCPTCGATYAVPAGLVELLPRRDEVLAAGLLHLLR